MKKILLSLLTIFTLILIPSNVQAKEKVTIYLFRGYNCSHCEEALSYIEKNRDKISDGIEFVSYEVWKNRDNANLMLEIQKSMNLSEDDEGSVPFFVVGEENTVGYAGARTFEEILAKAKKYQEEGNYKDVVKETIKKNSGVKYVGETLEDLFPEANKVVTIIVFSVFGLLIVGFIAMICFSRN